MADVDLNFRYLQVLGPNLTQVTPSIIRCFLQGSFHDNSCVWRPERLDHHHNARGHQRDSACASIAWPAGQLGGFCRRALHRYDAQDHTTRCLEIVPRHIVQNLTEHPVEFRQTWDLQACLNFQTLGYFIGL